MTTKNQKNDMIYALMTDCYQTSQKRRLCYNLVFVFITSLLILFGSDGPTFLLESCCTFRLWLSVAWLFFLISFKKHDNNILESIEALDAYDSSYLTRESKSWFNLANLEIVMVIGLFIDSFYDWTMDLIS